MKHRAYVSTRRKPAMGNQAYISRPRQWRGLLITMNRIHPKLI